MAGRREGEDHHQHAQHGDLAGPAGRHRRQVARDRSGQQRSPARCAAPAAQPPGQRRSGRTGRLAAGRWGPQAGPAEVDQQQGDEEQVQQVVERLGRKVVLADPVADGEDEHREPLGPPARPHPAGDQAHRHEAQQVHRQRPETQDRDQVAAADRVLGQRDQIEEAGPAEVGGQLRGSVPGPGDVVDETGDPVGRGEPRLRLGDDGDPIQAHHDGHQGGAQQQRLRAGQAQRRDEGQGQQRDPGQRRGRHDRDQAQTVHPAQCGGHPPQRREEQHDARDGPGREHGRRQPAPPVPPVRHAAPATHTAPTGQAGAGTRGRPGSADCGTLRVAYSHEPAPPARPASRSQRLAPGAAPAR